MAAWAIRTARRWLRRYRAEGLAGLVRPARGDAGQRKLSADLKSLIEGLALRKPRRTVAALHREVTKIATEREVAAPSALHTALALRQAIWRKANPAWPVHGIPDVLYVDHGSDFTSDHLEQVAAALRIELIFSTVGRPQGRGKVERFFRTINDELLPGLAGHLVEGKTASAPALSLTELDAALMAFIVGDYNQRPHSQIDEAPHAAWLGKGWLPRMPDRLDDLDLLLMTVAKARAVQRDGIHFQGTRYIDTTLAAYVGESVTIRFDPRDVSEIRVYHRNRFLCRAVSPEYADRTVTLKDIETARTAYRRSLRSQIRERVGRVLDFLPASAPAPAESPRMPAKKSKLRTYFEGD